MNVAIITGATSGIGFETAKALLIAGYRVVIASRSHENGEKAVAQLRTFGSVSFQLVDLAHFSSIHQFAKHIKRLDLNIQLLINNAGIMIPPFSLTQHGFEQQFATNHLGHFALTGLLLPHLLSSPQSRIITITSIAAMKGKIDYSSVRGETIKSPMAYYRQSKLANWFFAKELDNRLKKMGAPTISLAAHPGLAYSNLLSRGTGKKANRFVRTFLPLVIQSSEQGAASTIYASLSQNVSGGEWVGPSGFQAWSGKPAISSAGEALFQTNAAKKLWSFSEEATGMSYLS